MQTVPQNREALIDAIRRQDSDQLRLWLDQFSTPQETYAALRALAESFAAYTTGPEHELATWANDKMSRALDPS